MPLDDAILGHGVYTPREAARLVGTTSQQVLRWTRGSGPAEPLWGAHYQFLDDDVTEISFLDLIEVRVVAALRRASISLQAIRYAIAIAQEKYGIERPLAFEAFKTDGSEILMKAAEGDDEYVSLSRKRPGQKVFGSLIAESLNDLEYESSFAARWRPNGFSGVIIDPKRRFGDPLFDDYGIATGLIYQEFKEFQDASYLADIYEIPLSVVKTGIGFEKSLDEAYG